MQPPVPAETPADGVGRADAWFAAPAHSTGWRERLDTLDAEEQRRFAAITDPATAQAYAALHLLARDVLGHVVGVDPSLLEFDRTCARCGAQHGAPRLVGHADLHLSLSRTHDLVAVAVSSDAPVGIDVERVSGTGFAGFDAVATHPTERSADLDDHGRAVSWVRKEAVLKALGVGFVVDPARLATPMPGRPGLLLPGRPPVSVVDIPLDDDGHVAALGLATAYGAVAVTVHPGPAGS